MPARISRDDWNIRFSNSGHVPGSEHFADEWAAEAAAYRANGVKADLGIAYGDAAREAMDIFWPDTSPKGLAVFVHGGYWMKFDRSYWSHFAEGARANGWAVCLPSYTLAPELPISGITGQIGQAITKAATLVDGPIQLAGHSAGGHLVSRMLCDDSPLSAEVLDRIKHVLSISGVHDLRPLMNTDMNDSLKLDNASATSESQALRQPKEGINATAWVGGGELPEFLRQSQILQQMWSGFDVRVRYVADGDHNHFSVIEDLRHADSPITQAFLGED